MRQRQGIPVLVTSMERKGGLQADTLGSYPDQVRAVALEDDVAFIDLHAMSKVLYQALGSDLDQAFQDGTHHNNFGSYQLAQCVVQGIRQNQLKLADAIVDDFTGYDPAKPDRVVDFFIAESPLSTTLKPDGS